MIRRALGPLVLAAVVLAWAAPAHAGKTYCISGFEPGADYGAETGAKTQQDACSDSCFRGSGWHQHGFLRKNGQCYSCWDENDNTCKDLAEADGYTLISLQSCEGAPIVSPQDEPGSCYPDTPPPPPKPDPPPDPPPDDTSQQPPPRQPDPPPEPVAPPPIKLKAPPPPRPTDYDGVIVSIGPGPYAVNTPIRVVGGAKTRAGKVRRVPRGDFVVLGPDGQEVARVHGKPKGRGVVADVTIPVGGAITIRFEPKSVITSPGESLASISPADQQIQVAGCRVQAQLDAPTHGEILVADAQAALRGHFVDAGGQPASAAALSGAHARFLVEIAGEEQRLDAAVDDAGVATASVLIAKPASASEVVRISLIAEGGTGDVCPSSPIEARVTALGVGIEITADVRAGAGEAHCYVDRPCAVTARFRLPTDPTARALGEQFVRSAGLVMTASAGGAPGKIEPSSSVKKSRSESGRFNARRKKAAISPRVTASSGRYEVSTFVIPRLAILMMLPRCTDSAISEKPPRPSETPTISVNVLGKDPIAYTKVFAPSATGSATDPEAGNTCEPLPGGEFNVTS